MGSEPGVQAAARGDTTLVRLEGSESPLLRILAATNRFDERAQLIPAAMAVPRVQAAGSRHVQQVAIGSVWDRLADCESGDWGRGGWPIEGTARWDYGVSWSHGDIYEGGLNFHPATWDRYRDDVMPSHAGRATRAQQIVVAERVLDAQGWRAWPTCARKLGLR